MKGGCAVTPAPSSLASASAMSCAKGLESPAAVIAVLWNHSVVTPQAARGQKGAWPGVRPDEMAYL